MARQIYQTGDTILCAGGPSYLVNNVVFGDTGIVPSYFGVYEGSSIGITSATLVGTIAYNTSYASLYATYGEGDFFLISTNMSFCSDYPSAYSNQGSGYMYFHLSADMVTNIEDLVPEPETCSDGILNQDETAIDLGGVCRTVTRLENPIPVPFSTVDSNVFPFSFDYYIDDVDASLYSKFQVTVCPLAYLQDYDNCYKTTIDIGSPNVINSYVGEATVPIDHKGEYQVIIDLWNGGSTTCWWMDIYCDPTPSLTQYFGGWTFNVINPSGENGTPENTVIIGVGGIGAVCGTSLADLPCNLGVALQNLFSYIFVPNLDKFSFLSTFYNDIKTKTPFNFVDVIVTSYSDLATGTASDSDISIAIGSSSITLFSASLFSTNPIAPLVRGSLVVVFWMMLAFALYSRAINLFSSDITPTSKNMHY